MSQDVENIGTSFGLMEGDIPVELYIRIMEDVGAWIPLIPEGNRIVIDETALEGLISEAAAPVRSALDRILSRNKKFALSPEQVGVMKDMLKDEFNTRGAELPFDAQELNQETQDPQRRLIMAPPQKISEGYEFSERMYEFREWLCARHALVKAGAHVDVVVPAPDEGGVREVYTRDRYILINNTAYLPDPDFVENAVWCEAEEYQAEIAQIQKNLEAQGVRTVIVPDTWFEGGNVIRHFGSRTIFVGVDREGEKNGHTNEQDVGNLLAAINETQDEEWAAVPVPLIRDAMYHMDTGMSEELPGGEVLLSPLLTDKKTYKEICRIVGPENVIEITDDDADNLATNLINVGNTVVMTGNCEDAAAQMEKRGYKVVMPDDYEEDSFEFGGGGVHCMTNDVRSAPLPRKSFGPALG